MTGHEPGDIPVPAVPPWTQCEHSKVHEAPDTLSDEPDAGLIQGTQEGAKETRNKELETGTPAAQL